MSNDTPPPPIADPSGCLDGGPHVWTPDPDDPDLGDVCANCCGAR